MQRKERDPLTLARARKVVEGWDCINREDEAETAQANYLEALSYGDDCLARVIKRTRRWPARKRNRAIAEERKHVRAMIRAARRRADHPTIYSHRVTGQALSDVARIQTVPRESRKLAGIRSLALHWQLKPLPAFGPKDRTESIVLRSTDGRILATVVVAGEERDLFARLLAMLSTRTT